MGERLSWWQSPCVLQSAQHEFGLCLVSCLTFDKAVILPRFRYLVSKMKIIIPASRESVGHTSSLYLNRTSSSK